MIVDEGIARVCFEGGGLILPAKTPYEREILFEYADHCAKLRRHVRVEIDGRELTVVLRGDKPETCATCGQRLDKLTYAIGARNLCRFCASRYLH